MLSSDHTNRGLLPAQADQFIHSQKDGRDDKVGEKQRLLYNDGGTVEYSHDVQGYDQLVGQPKGTKYKSAGSLGGEHVDDTNDHSQQDTSKTCNNGEKHPS